MGWWKRFRDNVLPWIAGGVVGGVVNNIRQDKQEAKNTSVAPAQDTSVATGNLPQEEMDKLVAQRMARMGKYFSSPSGVLGNGNTGSQKVFS